ncbi:MAG: glutamate racemase [Campylobacterales bacterium]
MRCGIFDSGIGGLTVAGELLKGGVFNRLIYFGDTARVPYGGKHESTIIRYSLEALEFLRNFDPDFLVVACNSASAVALEELRREAEFPVVGVVEAGVEGVVQLARQRGLSNPPILLTGTKATINSNLYQRLLKGRGFTKIYPIPTPLLVPIVEEGLWDGPVPEAIFTHYFSNLPREEIEIVVLGCTHYPFLTPLFKKYFPNSGLVHSGKAILHYLTRYYNLPIGRYKDPKIEIYASENVKGVRETARRWMAQIGAPLSEGF